VAGGRVIPRDLNNNNNNNIIIIIIINNTKTDLVSQDREALTVTLR